MSTTPARNGHNSNSSPRRPIRTRASQACQQCRLRKVKCGLVETGSPCHNCRFDNIECTTALSKRSRRYRLQNGQLTQNRGSQRPDLTQTQSQYTASSSSPTGGRPNEAEHTTSTPSYPEHPSPSLQALSTTEPDIRPESVRDLGPSIGLPAYIRPSQRDIEPEELEFLQRRGALSIPDTPLRDQLLLSFILHVHPYLPVLDLQDFVDAVEGRSRSAVSLILFQAVMFAGTAYVDLHLLLDAGFENRIAARAHAFKKIKASSN